MSAETAPDTTPAAALDEAANAAPSAPETAVFCVGNRLMLDDGVGPATYDYLLEHYRFPPQVDLFDVGCMSMDMISKVEHYDLLISVDAVDGTPDEPGTVYRYEPRDIARTDGPMSSLHELKLADLFDAAELLGHSADGMCFGMRVFNMAPVEFAVGLTPDVEARVPFFAECVVAELVRRGHEVRRADGTLVTPES